MAEQLRAALFPLDVQFSGLVALALRSPPTAFGASLRALFDGLPADARPVVSDADLEAIRWKINSVPMPLLGPQQMDSAPPEVVPTVTECVQCHAALLSEPSQLALALTYHGGVRPLTYVRKRCAACSITYQACMWAPDAEQGAMYPASDLRAAEFFPVSLVARRHSDVLAFVHRDVLEFYTLAVVHLRAGFDNLMSVWASFFKQGKLEHSKGTTLHAWLYWRAATRLWPLHEAEMKHIPFYSARHTQEARAEAMLTQLMKRWFLEEYSRRHTCDVCSRLRSCGVDNKESLRVRTCASCFGGSRVFSETNVRIQYGCTNPPALRCYTCLAHKTPASAENAGAAAEATCLNEHVLIPAKVEPDGWCITCDACGLKINIGASFLHCPSGCDYDLCSSCATTQFSTGRPTLTSMGTGTDSAPSISQSTTTQKPAQAHLSAKRQTRSAKTKGSARAADASEPAEGNPCGISKDGKKRGSTQRNNGVLTCILACGIIANIAICAGSESATQIFAMLGEVRARRVLQYVIYDNACMLAHFVRNQARRRNPPSITSLLACAIFVIDNFHRKNHTACLDPTSRAYMPEVDIQKHDALKALNSSQSEQWNSWLSQFATNVKHMRFGTLDLYLLLVADLWNSVLLPQSRHLAYSPSLAQARSRLKRRRGAQET